MGEKLESPSLRGESQGSPVPLGNQWHGRENRVTAPWVGPVGRYSTDKGRSPRSQGWLFEAPPSSS